jgi:hypothetical protein
MSWLVLAVTLYVSLDLANPLMPGALMFGVEDSVKARQSERFRGQDDTTLVAATLPPEGLEPSAPRPAVDRISAGVDGGRPPEAPRARSSLSTPAAPSEDHH